MPEFKNAVDDLVVGLGNKLTSVQQQEYKDLDLVIDNLKGVRDSRHYCYYIETLPKEFAKQVLVGVKFISRAGWKCDIRNITKSDKGSIICIVGQEGSQKQWRMYLSTIIVDGTFVTKNTALDRYLVKLNALSTRQYLDKLIAKKKAYAKLYKKQTKEARYSINRELNKHVNDMTVSRNAIRTAIKSLQKDTKVIADAWNSTLTKQEQETLLGWIAGNIYSMRLYVVQGSRWEKAITELYPEEQYGKARKTVPSECSKDSIGGYISLNNVNNIPYDILKKITHKEKNEDIVKQNKGSSKYRINNYLLVLYLLNNYNQRGFKLGVTNLNKNITLG